MKDHDDLNKSNWSYYEEYLKNAGIKKIISKEEKEKIKIIFDCVIPFEDKYDEEYLINYLKENIASKKYYYYIEIDRPYC